MIDVIQHLTYTPRCTVVDDFLEAEEYNGFKDGYIFKRSKWGTGYYADKGPFGPVDDYDVNAGMVVTKVPEYDMDAHARGESVVEPPKEPGHGRVGALGDLLAGALVIISSIVRM